MADIFGGTQPPAWLERLAQPADMSIASKVTGELVGGFANAAEDAIKSADNKTRQGIETSWIKELPNFVKGDLAEARLNMQSPLWKMQAQQAQLNMAQQGIGIQNQLSLIESRAQNLRMQQHDQEVLPQWMRDHPTWESRQNAEAPVLFTPQAQKMFRDIQLGDTANMKHKAQVAAVTSFGKQIDELNKLGEPGLAGQFASQLNAGQVPTPKMLQDMQTALGQARAKKAAAGLGTPQEIHFQDGTSMKGVIIGNHFYQQTQPRAGTQPRLSEAQRSELTYARERALAAQKALDAAVGPDAKAAAQNELFAARKYYNQKLKDAAEAQAKLTGPKQNTPMVQSGPADDPLSLFKQNTPEVVTPASPDEDQQLIQQADQTDQEQEQPTDENQ